MGAVVARRGRRGVALARNQVQAHEAPRGARDRLSRSSDRRRNMVGSIHRLVRPTQPCTLRPGRSGRSRVSFVTGGLRAVVGAGGVEGRRCPRSREANDRHGPAPSTAHGDVHARGASQHRRPRRPRPRGSSPPWSAPRPPPSTARSRTPPHRIFPTSFHLDAYMLEEGLFVSQRARDSADAHPSCAPGPRSATAGRASAAS